MTRIQTQTRKKIKPKDVPKNVLDAWIDYIDGSADRFIPMKRRNCYASGYERCVRKLTLLLTDGDKVKPFDIEVRARMERGRDRERNTISDLIQIGRYARPQFDIIEQQDRFELRDKKGRVAITGKVDFKIKYEHSRMTVPCELKDWHPNVTDRIQNFDDVLAGRWTQKGARQLLCYLYGFGERFGMLVLTRPGLPKLIPVYFEDYLDIVEDFMQKAEEALDHKEAGTLPDCIDDPEECKLCDFFGDLCNPPSFSGEGAIVINDPEIEQMLEKHQNLVEQKREFDALDKQIKRTFRDIETAVVGHYLVKGRYGRKTWTDLPPKIKEKYTKTDPKGKFFIDIIKTGD